MKYTKEVFHQLIGNVSKNEKTIKDFKEDIRKLIEYIKNIPRIKKNT